MVWKILKRFQFRRGVVSIAQRDSERPNVFVEEDGSVGRILQSFDEMWTKLSKVHVHNPDSHLQDIYNIRMLRKKWDRVLKLSRFIRPHLASKRKQNRFLTVSKQNRERYAEYLYWKLYVLSIRSDGKCNIENHFLDELRNHDVTEADLKILHQILLQAYSTELFGIKQFLDACQFIIKYGSASIKSRLDVLMRPVMHPSPLFEGYQPQVVGGVSLLLPKSVSEIWSVNTKADIPFWRIGKRVAAHVEGSTIQEVGVSCTILSMRSAVFTATIDQIQSLEVFDPEKVLELLGKLFGTFCSFRTSLEREYQAMEDKKYKWFRSLFGPKNQLYGVYQADQLKIYQALLGQYSQLLQDVSCRFDHWLKSQHRDQASRTKVRQVEDAFKGMFKQMKEEGLSQSKLFGSAPILRNISASYNLILSSIDQYEKKEEAKQAKIVSMEDHFQDFPDFDQKMQQEVIWQTGCPKSEEQGELLQAFEEKRDHYLVRLVQGQMLTAGQQALLCHNACKSYEDHSLDQNKSYCLSTDQLALLEGRLNNIFDDIQTRGIFIEEYRQNLSQIISYLIEIHHEDRLSQIETRLLSLFQQLPEEKSLRELIERTNRFSKHHWSHLVDRDQSRLVQEEQKANKAFCDMLKRIKVEAEGLPWHRILQEEVYAKMSERGVIKYEAFKCQLSDWEVRPVKNAEAYIKRKYDPCFYQQFVRVLEYAVACAHKVKRIEQLCAEYGRFVKTRRWLVSSERMRELYEKYRLDDLHPEAFQREHRMIQSVCTV
jgi:hypothetical protein